MDYNVIHDEVNNQFYIDLGQGKYLIVRYCLIVVCGCVLPSNRAYLQHRIASIVNSEMSAQAN